MKNFLLILIWGFTFCQHQCFAQPLGFVQSECGIISNPHYSFEYIEISPHYYGYDLLHNGYIIIEEVEFEPGPCPVELKFVDDTTGFFISYEPVLGSSMVYKIINDSVIYLGLSKCYLYNSFVVSRHTIYLTTGVDYQGYFCLAITKLSDLANKKSFLNMDTIAPDTTFHDTIFGLPFCQGLNRLDFLYKNSSDTLDYTILFRTDTLADIAQQKESDFRIVPNPASDFIRIFSPSNENVKSILILDNLGRKMKYLISDNTTEKVIYIGDLDVGVYFLFLEYGDTKRVYKFIKI